jgi:hypothetical protein
VRNLPSCSEVITGPATARRLSCSRDSVAAACTAALVAATRSCSSSSRREKPRFLLGLRQLPGRVQARPACCPSHGLPGPGRLASVRSLTRCGKGLKPRPGLRGQEEPDPASVRPDGQHRRCPARRPGGGHLHRRVRPAGPATPPRPAMDDPRRRWAATSPSATGELHSPARGAASAGRLQALDSGSDANASRGPSVEAVEEPRAGHQRERRWQRPTANSCQSLPRPSVAAFRSQGLCVSDREGLSPVFRAPGQEPCTSGTLRSVQRHLQPDDNQAEGPVDQPGQQRRRP